MELTAREYRKLNPEWKEPLAKFFIALQEAGDSEYFHPHPLTAEEAERLTQYTGKDLYYILVKGDQVLGYGMLRGWDEGFEIPSLGIAICPSERRKGLGRNFMSFLHAAARRRGAKKVRLKVYPNNLKAIQLYRELGYSFQAEEAGQMVGVLNL